MKRTAVALALVFALGSVAFALPAETVKGAIIDTACYTSGAHGAEQTGCTEMCIDSGVPPSLLTEDGRVILLLPDRDAAEAYEKAKELAAKTVEIEGEMLERGGMTAIKVTSVAEAD